MRRVAVTITAIALGLALLAGCTPAPTALSEEVSSDMQSGVVAVADAAAAGDAVGALARLDELQQKLDAARASGDVSAERADAIQAAIDTVRTDLAPTPESTPEPTAEPQPDPTADPGVTDDGDDDNSGPGNNNGNGNSGNGKGKDKED